jgi:hypothetical protein
VACKTFGHKIETCEEKTKMYMTNQFWCKVQLGRGGAWVYVLTTSVFQRPQKVLEVSKTALNKTKMKIKSSTIKECFKKSLLLKIYNKGFVIGFRKQK